MFNLTTEVLSFFAPKALSRGSHIRVVSPSRSCAILSDETKDVALATLADLGLSVSFSENCFERDVFDSSSIESRLRDLHAAFADPSVDGILTSIGGFNSIELLDRLDYGLIRENPKVICGYSDITSVLSAISAKTGLVTYYGPHFSTFGIRQGNEYTIEHFRRAVLSDASFTIDTPERWSSDDWYLDQDNRQFHDDEGLWEMSAGETVQGRAVGGNTTTLLTLFGTTYLPVQGKLILFIEDDRLIFPQWMAGHLRAITLQPWFESVAGVVIGRFEMLSGITKELLEKMIYSNEALKRLPVLANASFGHTNPICTVPLGQEVVMNSTARELRFLSPPQK